MKKKFYRVIKHHYICAVCDLLEDRVYIEKTCAKNPKSRYYAHLRGEVKATADELSLEVIEKDFVAFRVLESLECTGAEAYKHVVAWGRFFKKEGCTLLMAPKTIAACEDLLPETEEIYRKVCAPVTLEEVWRRKIPIEKESAEAEKKHCLKQMNIRVREDVIDWFKDFCRGEQLTQSEGLFKLLLSYPDQSKESQQDMFAGEIRRRDREIEGLKAEIARLKK